MRSGAGRMEDGVMFTNGYSHYCSCNVSDIYDGASKCETLVILHYFSFRSEFQNRRVILLLLLHFLHQLALAVAFPLHLLLVYAVLFICRLANKVIEGVINLAEGLAGEGE